MAFDTLILDPSASDTLVLDVDGSDWLVLVTEDISHLFRWLTYTAAPGLIHFTIGSPVHYTADQGLMHFTASVGLMGYTAADSLMHYTAMESD